MPNNPGMQNDARSVDAQKQSGTSLDGNKKRFILPEPEVEENYLVTLILSKIKYKIFINLFMD